MQVEALETSGSELFTVIDVLESPEPDPLDKNDRVEHQMVLDRIEKKRDTAWDMESTMGVTDTKANSVNVKKAFRGFRGPATADRSAMCSTVENWYHLYRWVATALAKLQLQKGLLLPRLTIISNTRVTYRRLRL